MSGDWRDPVIPVGIEENPDEVVVRRDGTYRHSFHLILTERDMGRIRAGYVCARCYGPHEHAFPESCNDCGFEMSRLQSETVAKEYKGVTRVGPSTTDEEELEIAEEWVRERRLREEGLKTTQSGIVVPAGIR